ncbi:MAG: cytochrome P460 family protein [Planctomycetia bacterium]|nr:cytochrome P460 family protein [Planctomycetia bacterium]
MRRTKFAFAFLTVALTTLAMGADAPSPVVNAENVWTFYREFKPTTKEPLVVLPFYSSVGCISTFYSSIPSSHAGLIRIYSNPVGEKRLAGETKGPFPVGSVIVKEKLTQENKAVGIGGMIKRAPGYDADNGDWEYFYVDKEAAFSTGKMTHCMNCHAQSKDNDYVAAVRNIAKPVSNGVNPK